MDFDPHTAFVVEDAVFGLYATMSYRRDCTWRSPPPVHEGPSLNADELLAFVDSCYSTPLETSDFSRLLDDVCHLLGLRGATVISYDPERTPEPLISSSLIELDRPFREYWWQHETRIAKGKRIAPGVGQVLSDCMYFPRHEQRNDPYIQEFCRPNGLGDFMGYFAQDPVSKGRMTVSAIRDRSHADFDESDHTTFKIIASHVARAYTLNSELHAYRSTIEGMTSTIEQAGFGLILLDSSGSVIFWNATAEALLRNAVRIRRGQSLTSKLSPVQTGIDRLVRHTLSHALHSGEDDAVTLGSSDGGDAVVLRGYPLNGTSSAFARTARAALVVRALAAPTTRSIVGPLQQLGLTPTEARVAMGIGRGAALQSLSDRLSMKPNTLRVHLRHIYRKLDIDRQSKLCKIVSSIDHNLSN